MARHIDLYQAHRLDRQRSSAELSKQLKGQLDGTDPRDAVERGRIEVAGAILGGKKARQAYDQHLADPVAPLITEPVLAAMAAEAVKRKKRKSKAEWAGAAVGSLFGLS